jgi:hypothetical protein
LGTWGDLFDLEGNSPEAEAAKRHFYNTVHFPFGLPTNLARSGQKYKYPITMRIRSGTIHSFEIIGQQLAVSMFTERSWSNIFSRIQREIPVRPKHHFVFDISGLPQGKLSGYQEIYTSPEIKLSEERLEILNTIGLAVIGRHTAPPLVYVEQGETWNAYGIPDRIYIQLFTFSQVQQYDIKSLTRAIYHRYNVLAHDNALDISCTFDNVASVFNFQASPKRIIHNEHPNQGFAPTQSSPHQEESPNDGNETDNVEDSFPYAYFESIGLIDSDGMVMADTILGVIRVHARSEIGRTTLLEAGKKL